MCVDIDDRTGARSGASDDDIRRVLAALEAGPVCVECVVATVRLPARRFEAVWEETLRHTVMSASRCNSCGRVKVTYQRADPGSTREP